MSNIPMDSSYILGRYYGLRASPPRVIGGVLRTEADACFGSYCSKPTSIYYIKPQCVCTNTTSPLKIDQTLYSSWFENGKTVSQFGGIITNTGSVTVTNPTFTSSPLRPNSIWGLAVDETKNTWALQWYPVIQQVKPSHSVTSSMVKTKLLSNQLHKLMLIISLYIK